jgi:hypothetical protein
LYIALVPFYPVIYILILSIWGLLAVNGRDGTDLTCRSEDSASTYVLPHLVVRVLISEDGPRQDMRNVSDSEDDFRLDN